MDERTRQIFERARDTLDALADFEPTPRDPLADDTLLTWEAGMPPTRHRSGSSELIYKTNHNALVEKPTVTKPPLFSPEQVDVIGYTISELRHEWRQHVANEIQKLRVELEHDSNKVLEWPRKRNVA